MPRTEAEIFAMVVTLQLIARQPTTAGETARRTLDNIGVNW